MSARSKLSVNVAEKLRKPRNKVETTLKHFRINDDIQAYEASKHYTISAFSNADRETYYDVVSPGEFIIVAQQDKAMKVLVMTEKELCQVFGIKRGKKLTTHSPNYSSRASS
jgi:hypothetical protein